MKNWTISLWLVLVVTRRFIRRGGKNASNKSAFFYVFIVTISGIVLIANPTLTLTECPDTNSEVLTLTESVPPKCRYLSLSLTLVRVSISYCCHC